MKTLIFLLLPLCSLSQRYSAALTHCAGFTGTAIGYATGKTIFGEVGLKSNGQQYYTMPYIGAGVQAKGDLYLSLSAGYGPVLNIPQRDLPVVKTGYTVKVLHGFYTTGRIGYGKRLQVYAAGTLAGRNWGEIGLMIKGE
jgi:hypothetical protein